MLFRIILCLALVLTGRCDLEPVLYDTLEPYDGKAHLALTQSLNQIAPCCFTFSNETNFTDNFTITIASGGTLTFLSGSNTTFLNHSIFEGQGRLIAEASANITAIGDFFVSLSSSFTHATLTLLSLAHFTSAAEFTLTSIHLLLSTQCAQQCPSANVTLNMSGNATFRNCTLDLGHCSNLEFYGAFVHIVDTELLGGLEGSVLTTPASTELILGGQITLATALAIVGEGALTFESAASLVISAALSIAKSFSLASTTIVVLDGGSLAFAASSMAFDFVTLTFTGATLAFRQGVISMTSAKILGSGFLNLFYDASATVTTQTQIVMTSTVVELPLQLNGCGCGSNRRTNLTTYVTALLCGTTLSTVALDSGTALELQQAAACQVSGTEYSNVFASLTAASGSVVAITSITSSSLPTRIVSLSDPENLPLDVVSSNGDSSFTQVLILYDNPGSCPNSFPSANITGCAGGSHCSVIGRVLNSTYCTIEFDQRSDDLGLLGLLALLALPLLLGLCYLLAKRRKPAEEQEPKAVYYDVLPPAYMGPSPTPMPDKVAGI